MGEQPPGTAAAGEAFAELVAVMDRLRSPGGCPWDAEQTHASLAPYAIEEAYEVAEAAERGDAEHLREELGDLLLQVVFHARVAQESTEAPFDVVAVVRGLIAKLVRRHPHVFAGVAVTGAEEVATRWSEIKRSEQERDITPDHAFVLDGIPLALPALARAQKVVSRAREAGFPAPEQAPPGAPEQAPPGATSAATDVGVRLLDLVAAADRAGVDAEAALRIAVDRYVETVSQGRGEGSGRTRARG